MSRHVHPQLRSSLETLLAPLDSRGSDTWRDEVCQRLRTLAGSDIVFFRLSDEGPSRIDPTGPLPARDAYRRDFRQFDPWPGRHVPPGRILIATHESLIGERRLRRDTYYNEFVRPFAISNYVGIQAGTVRGEHAHLGIFNYGRRLNGDAQRAVMARLRAVLPAFQTGLRAWLMARRHPEGIEELLDRLGDPLALCDGSGRFIHANTALAGLLAREPDEAGLRRGIEHHASALLRARGGEVKEMIAAGGPREIPTPLGAYRVRAVTVDSLLSRQGVILLLEPPGRATDVDPPAAERLNLTRREAEVARLLALGRDNEEIADALGVTSTTARNHTARVLRKLGIRSRAKVHAVLYPG